MGIKNYPRDMYGGHRYLDYTLISAVTINRENNNSAFTNSRLETSGNETFSYPWFTANASVGSRPITQIINFLYDAATQKISENPYYLIDPLLSRLYYQDTTVSSFRGSNTTIKYNLSLDLLPYQLLADYYVSVIKLSIIDTLTNQQTIRIMPVALKPNSIKVLNNVGAIQASINNQPIATATSPNLTNLPYLACCWYIPGMAAINNTINKYGSQEIYNICRLTSFSYQPLGIPGAFSTTPFNISSPNSVVKPSTTLTDQFDYLNAAQSSAICPVPNYQRDAAFFINGNNTTSSSPYDSRSGAMIQTPNGGFTPYIGWDKESASNYLVTVDLSFECYRVQLPGINTINNI